MNRKEILEKAESLVNGPRAQDYGDAYDNHERIATMWSVLLGTNVSVSQVYQCMVAVKLARLIVTPDHEDSWVDICGYGALEEKAMALQMAMFAPKSEWVLPAELPDIFDAKQIAIDVETRDPNIKSNGPGWPTGDGEVVGYAIAVDGWSGYIPPATLAAATSMSASSTNGSRKCSSLPPTKSCTTRSTTRAGSGKWALPSTGASSTPC